MENLQVFLEVIKQIAIAVGIISSSSIVTGILNAAINIQDKTVKHIVSWVVPIVGALLLCAFGQISFGFGYWDYLMSAFAGAVVGGASNGLYDWTAISNIIDKFYDLFHHNKEDKD